MKIKYVAADRLDGVGRLRAKTVLVMPAVDMTLARRCAELMARRAGAEGLILVLEDVRRAGFVSLCNLAFRQTDSEFFGYVAQDAFPGRAWLNLALLALGQSGKSMLAFNDGKWHGLLAGFGLVRREWAVSQYEGDLFYAGYRRHYADAELTLIARSQQAFCYEPRSVLVEVDWEKDGKPVDAEDQVLFRSRGASLFEGRVSDLRYTRILPRKASS